MNSALSRITALVATTTLVAAPLLVPSNVSAADNPATLAATYAAMDANLTSLNGQASSLNGQISDVNSTIAKLEAETAALVPVIEQKEEMLKSSIREAYINGQSSSLKVVVSNGSLSSMLDQQHYQSQVGSKSKKAALELTDAKRELDQKAADAKQKREGLLALKGQLDEKIATEQSQIQARAALVVATQNKEEEFQKIRAAAAMDEAAAIASPSPVKRGSSGSTSSGNPGFSGRSNPYPWGQCTWYVYDQTGRGQNGNAGTWHATSSTPGVGKIMIWAAGEQGAGGAGHVGVVIGVSGSSVTIRHMNWHGVGVVSTETFHSTGKFY